MTFPFYTPPSLSHVITSHMNYMEFPLTYTISCYLVSYIGSECMYWCQKDVKFSFATVSAMHANPSSLPLPIRVLMYLYMHAHRETLLSGLQTISPSSTIITEVFPILRAYSRKVVHGTGTKCRHMYTLREVHADTQCIYMIVYICKCIQLLHVHIQHMIVGICIYT